MGHFFGTDGIRGIANLDLTPELVFRVGRSIAALFTQNKRPKVVVGKDPRLSSDMLEGALLAGALSIGADIYLCGIVPTPAVSFITCNTGMDLGIMISASHNPIEHNGIKIFSSTGLKLLDEEEEKIENYLLGEVDKLPRPIGKEIGLVRSLENPLQYYSNHLKSTFGSRLLSGLHIVLDCAYGATSVIAPKLFEELGAKVSAHCAVPDGSRINVECGATHLNYLKKAVLNERADLGIAFDGDGDRVMFVDKDGETLNGDGILVALALHWQKQGKLKGPVVTTVMANFGVEQVLQAVKIPFVRTPVGDRYVLEEMLRNNANLGGEQSGHLILLDHAYSGDGCLTALQVLAVMLETDKTIADLRKLLREFPQLLINVPVHNKKLFHEDLEIQKMIQEAEGKLQGRGRILVRPSGTEPLVRVMAEGPDTKELEEVISRVAKTIELRLK